MSKTQGLMSFRASPVCDFCTSAGKNCGRRGNRRAAMCRPGTTCRSVSCENCDAERVAVANCFYGAWCSGPEARYNSRRSRVTPEANDPDVETSSASTVGSALSSMSFQTSPRRELQVSEELAYSYGVPGLNTEN